MEIFEGVAILEGVFRRVGALAVLGSGQKLRQIQARRRTPLSRRICGRAAPRGKTGKALLTGQAPEKAPSSADGAGERLQAWEAASRGLAVVAIISARGHAFPIGMD